MRGILCLLDARASKAFQRSRKEKEQVENVNLLVNYSLNNNPHSQRYL
ncbi:MAG: hypothetical protein AAF573_23390 [Bacteroidota bacterium]